MTKTRHVNEDKQVLKTVKECLREMGRPGEMMDSAETPLLKSSGDPIADLRELLAGSVVWGGGMPPRGEK